MVVVRSIVRVIPMMVVGVDWAMERTAASSAEAFLSEVRNHVSKGLTVCFTRIYFADFIHIERCLVGAFGIIKDVIQCVI